MLEYFFSLDGANRSNILAGILLLQSGGWGLCGEIKNKANLSQNLCWAWQYSNMMWLRSSMPTIEDLQHKYIFLMYLNWNKVQYFRQKCCLHRFQLFPGLFKTGPVSNMNVSNHLYQFPESYSPRTFVINYNWLLSKT